LLELFYANRDTFFFQNPLMNKNVLIKNYCYY